MQDSQFSALGLTLVAELAKTQKILGGFATQDSDALADKVAVSALETPGIPLGEDYGNVVGRPPIVGGEPMNLLKSSTVEESPKEHLSMLIISAEQGTEACAVAAAEVQHLSKRTKRKNRKPANPIDDLFAALH